MNDPHVAEQVVSVDRDRCAGHGVCLMHAPGVFDLDADGLSVVIDAAPSQIDKARQAAQNCPERAITLKELS